MCGFINRCYITASEWTKQKDSTPAIIATTIGVLFALLLFMLMSWMLHLNGFSSSEAESLILIHESTGTKD